jgi:hypothetical protein
MTIRDVEEVLIRGGKVYYILKDGAGTILHKQTTDIVINVQPNGYYRVRFVDESSAAVGESK